MSIKNYQIYYLLLIFAPLQCSDFLPTWYITSIISALTIRLFTCFHRYVLFIASIIGSYLLLKEFGYRIQPETAVGFLNIMICAQILQDTKQFQTNYVFGLLWVGSFALFNTNIFYFTYLLMSIAIIFRLFTLRATENFNFSTLSFSKKSLTFILKTTPIILLLFIIFPRFYGFFPSANIRQQNSIGYAQEINNSTTDNLTLSNRNAFYAEIKTQLNPELLYWRGSVLTKTDGYNWSREPGWISKNNKKASTPQSIEYTIKFEQSLQGDIILLDTPYRITKSNLRFYKEKEFNAFKTYVKNKKIILSAQSLLNTPQKEVHINKEKYLQLPKFIPNALQNIFNITKAKKTQDILNNVKNYLNQNNFYYTLSPGKLGTMKEFIQAKKGYCTHFASLLGVILRMNNVPTRLVSGFQGGKYNELGNYYLITANDAHAWVEYYDNNQWNRIDPTEFVAPLRISEGGNKYFAKESTFKQNYFTSFYKLQKYIENANYRISLFMDNFDRSQQKSIAQKINLKLKSFYTVGFLALMLLITIFFALTSRIKINSHDQIDKLFNKFKVKCRKKRVDIFPQDSLGTIKAKIIEKELSQEYIEFLQEYSERKFGPNKDHFRLHKLLKQLT